MGAKDSELEGIAQPLNLRFQDFARVMVLGGLFLVGMYLRSQVLGVCTRVGQLVSIELRHLFVVTCPHLPYQR